MTTPKAPVPKLLFGAVSETRGSYIVLETSNFKHRLFDDCAMVAGFRKLPFEKIWSLEPGIYHRTFSVNYKDDCTIIIVRVLPTK
jgi:hypothetical protein